MSVAIKHAKQTLKPQNDDYDVSADAWNEGHTAGTISGVLTDHNKENHDSLGLEAAAVAVQTIDGPDWADPTGSAIVVIQVNTALGESALCWKTGSKWNRVLNQITEL